METPTNEKEMMELEDLFDREVGDPEGVRKVAMAFMEEEEDLDRKVDIIAGLILHRRRMAEARKAEWKRIKSLADADCQRVKELSDAFKEHLEAIGRKKVETILHKVEVCKNGGKPPIRLNVKSVDDLPPRFVRKIKEPDMEAIRSVLENNEISYAEFVEKGTHLRIR
jgi:hypothetical protein